MLPCKHKRAWSALEAVVPCSREFRPARGVRLGCRTVKVVEERTVGRVSRYFVHIFTFLLVRFIHYCVREFVACGYGYESFPGLPGAPLAACTQAATLL